MKMLKGITKGLPQSGLQGGAGVGAFYLHRMLAAKIPALQTNPFLAPLGMIVLGHVLKKSNKLGTVGAALVGAGGYAAANIYEVKKSVSTQSAPQAQANTSGFENDDTGALVSARDIGALVSASDIGDIDDDTGNISQADYADAYQL
jgi:hypothetical protein